MRRGGGPHTFTDPFPDQLSVARIYAPNVLIPGAEINPSVGDEWFGFNCVGGVGICPCRLSSGRVHRIQLSVVATEHDPAGCPHRRGIHRITGGEGPLFPAGLIESGNFPQAVGDIDPVPFHQRLRENLRTGVDGPKSLAGFRLKGVQATVIGTHINNAVGHRGRHLAGGGEVGAPRGRAAGGLKKEVRAAAVDPIALMEFDPQIMRARQQPADLRAAGGPPLRAATGEREFPVLLVIDGPGDFVHGLRSGQLCGQGQGAAHHTAERGFGNFNPELRRGRRNGFFDQLVVRRGLIVFPIRRAQRVVLDRDYGQPRVWAERRTARHLVHTVN
ncbi:MAG: hypothetical protein BWX84_02527 [Verrucomicrobia bacterium ADurb.Bin118]|nr:MAG: hypothetical protein BWX84_02527 [Verrucomicrobia bacterium ADurb.Bin118]